MAASQHAPQQTMALQGCAPSHMLTQGAPPFGRALSHSCTDCPTSFDAALTSASAAASRLCAASHMLASGAHFAGAQPQLQAASSPASHMQHQLQQAQQHAASRAAPSRACGELHFSLLTATNQANGAAAGRPPMHLPLMSASGTRPMLPRIPKLGTVQTYNPVTGVRTLTNPALAAATAASLAAPLTLGQARGPHAASLQDMNQQQQQQRMLAAAQQQQQQLSMLQASSEQMRMLSPSSIQLLPPAPASSVPTLNAASTFGTRLSPNPEMASSGAWQMLLAGLATNLSDLGLGVGGAGPDSTPLRRSSNGSGAAEDEDLGLLLRGIGTDLARHGISVAVALEAGWLGHLSPASTILLEQAHAAETERLCRTTLNGGDATVGGNVGGGGSRAPHGQASLHASAMAMQLGQAGAMAAPSMLPTPPQQAPQGRVASPLTVTQRMGSFDDATTIGSVGSFSMEDPDSVLAPAGSHMLFALSSAGANGRMVRNKSTFHPAPNASCFDAPNASCFDTPFDMRGEPSGAAAAYANLQALLPLSSGLGGGSDDLSGPFSPLASYQDDSGRNSLLSSGGTTMYEQCNPLSGSSSLLGSVDVAPGSAEQQLQHQLHRQLQQQLLQFAAPQGGPLQGFKQPFSPPRDAPIAFQTWTPTAGFAHDLNARFNTLNLGLGFA